jgi:hypothetical protein
MKIYWTILLMLVLVLVGLSHMSKSEPWDELGKGPAVQLPKATGMYHITADSWHLVKDHKLPSFQWRQKIMIDHNITLVYKNGTFVDEDTGQVWPYKVPGKEYPWLEGTALKIGDEVQYI